MSIHRACQHCGRRLHGTTPGAMTILLDGQPIDSAVVLCSEGAIDVRRALDQLLNRARRNAVAEHAQRLNLPGRAPDQTTMLRPTSDAMTEHFRALDEQQLIRETHGTWPPRVEHSGNTPSSTVPFVGSAPQRRPTRLDTWRTRRKTY